jgi:hypothetical protein
MNVIDKILSEWSYRCHDGIVDMNDPKKVIILKEILIEEGIDDDILDATLNLPKEDPSSEEKKQKALAILKGTSSDEKDKEKINSLIKLLDDGSKKEKEEKAKALIAIEDELEKRNLKFSTAAQVIRTFARADEEENLIDYFGKDGNNLPKLEVRDGINIKTIPQERLNKDIINKIYPELAGASKTKGVGKEENFLVAFYKNVTKEEKGDVKIDGTEYEIKGVDSIVADINRGSKVDVINFLTDELNLTSEQKDLFIKRERWPYTLSKLYQSIKSEESKAEFLKKVKEALYKKYKINIDEQTLEDGKILATTLAKYLVLNYSGIKKDKIMFVSPEGVMKIYDSPEALSNAVGSEINITRFSDFAPRLAFKDPENDISKQSDEPAIEKEVQEIKIRDKADIKNISGIQYISKSWYDNHPTYQEYFNDKAPTIIPNFIPLKAEYKDTVKLVPYASLAEELTNYLIKSFK